MPHSSCCPERRHHHECRPEHGHHHHDCRPHPDCKPGHKHHHDCRPEHNHHHHDCKPHPHHKPHPDPEHGECCFVIKSKLDGKVMDIKGGGGKGTEVIAWSQKDNGSNGNQLWKFERADEGWFFIKSCKCDDLVLDIRKNCATPGTDAIVWHKKTPSRPNQMFRLRDERIESALGCDLVLDLKGAGCDNGTNIIIWKRKDCNDTNQRWELCVLDYD